MTNSLLSLYHSILAPVMCEWIRCDDLRCLDTAVCSFKLRTHLLACLCHCLIEAPSIRYHWALLRGIKLKRFYFDKVEALTFTILQSKIVSALHQLVIACEDESVLELCKRYNLTFTVLRIYGQKYKKEVIEGFLTSFEFSHLQLDSCSSPCILHDNFIGGIPTMCPSLRVLELPLSHSVVVNFEVCLLDQIINWSYCEGIKINLVRTAQPDPSAVCIGGSYYHAVEIRAQARKEAQTAVIPLLASVQSLEVERLWAELLRGMLVTCFQLKTLHLSSIFLPSFDYVVLFRHNPLLTDVSLAFSCGNNYSDIMHDILTECKHLQRLRVYGGGIKMSSLKCLLQNCIRMSDLSIGNVLMDFSLTLLFLDVQKLSLNDLNDKSEFVYECENTEYRSGTLHHLWYTGPLSYGDIKSMFSSYSNLRIVELIRNMISSDVLLHLVAGCPVLRTLILRVKVQLDFDCLSILSKCEHLIRLNLKINNIVTSDELKTFILTKPGMRVLILRCIEYPSDAHSLVKKYCLKIKEIDFSVLVDCNKVLEG